MAYITFQQSTENDERFIYVPEPKKQLNLYTEQFGINSVKYVRKVNLASHGYYHLTILNLVTGEHNYYNEFHEVPDPCISHVKRMQLIEEFLVNPHIREREVYDAVDRISKRYVGKLLDIVVSDSFFRLR